MGQVETHLSATPKTGDTPQNAQQQASMAIDLFHAHTLRMARHDLLVTILVLSRFIQRHRGATLALLGGDRSFRPQVQTLQQQINAQLEFIHCLNATARESIADNDWKQLSLGWHTIIKDLENDAIHHSFEFHSHLLELLLRVARQLSEAVLYQPPLAQMPEALRNRVEKTYLEPLQNLNQTCVIELYELVEYLARIRGMGTHMAAVGHSDTDSDTRVAFWLQEFRYRKDRFDQNLQVLPSAYLPFIPALRALPNLNMKLNYFINLLGHEMTSQRSIKIPSHKLFLMGTEIIDGYLNVMDQANAVIREQLHQMNMMCLQRLME
ncbi:MAG: hypothetical protein HPY82_11830 [Gammaproteobacteria bacterium]|nr:hypothetical protein [Gammaproteobacteria bacterium]